jgi:hypothetical protein
VSVLGGNQHHSCGTVELVAADGIVEIVNVHAVFTDIAAKMAGYDKRLSEYPTLSAIFCFDRSYGIAMAAASAPASAI